jgi:predicted RNA-binding Zn-ribbon protein involved in translation (DUF1610 family)
MIDAKRVANNILDFLIDPTRIPVEDRVYFRPEEILRNESYMKAKAEACEAYKDQKHNSDFYPQRNRSLINREANIMDRKSLIASFDVLSRNFKNSSDPFAHDLQVMARALSKMSDEELKPRLASDAPEIESVLAAKTFKCPTCGTKVLEQTSYCVKCRKKVKKAEEEKEAVTKQTLVKPFENLSEGDRRALLDALKKIAPRMKGKLASDDYSEILFAEITAGLSRKIIPALAVLLAMIAGGARAGDIEKAVADTTLPIEEVVGPLLDKADMPTLTLKLSPIQQRLQQDEDKAFQLDTRTGPTEAQPAKTAGDCFFWTKDASEHVAKALVSEIIGVVADEDEEEEGEEEETAEAPAEEAPAPEKKKEEAPAPEKKEEEVEAKKEPPKDEKESCAPTAKKEEVEAGKKKGPGVPDGTGPMSETPQCPMSEKKEASVVAVEEKKEEPKEAVTDKATTVVNTDVLATLNFAGIEMEAAIMDEAGEMSEQEKANLAKLF